jgi:ABC-2 type transport system ATP-binding protein
LSGRRRRERINWAIEMFELETYLNQTSHDLPLGFKQRLAMACALMHEPDILFLDEPTSGVDPMGRRDFWNKINALAEQGVTIMVTTHFMEEAEYCDRMAIMASGQILAIGSPADIKQGAGQTDMEEAFIHIIEQQKNKPDTPPKQEATG